MKEQEILQLENRVRDLKSRKEKIIKQRFTFPLDFATTQVIKKINLTATGKTYTTAGIVLADGVAIGVALGTNSNGLSKSAIGVFPLTAFTANAGTNFLSPSSGLVDGSRVRFTYSGTLPAPLSDGVNYYAISVTSSSFKVSLSLGGSEVDITDTGTGTHYFAKS